MNNLEQIKLISIKMYDDLYEKVEEILTSDRDTWQEELNDLFQIALLRVRNNDHPNNYSKNKKKQ